MVEDQGGRQGQAGGGGEPVAQVESGQRVESQLPEGAFGPDRVRVAVPQDCRDLAADEVEDGRVPFGTGQGCQPPGRLREGRAGAVGRGRPVRHGSAARVGQVGQQHAGPCGGVRGGEPGPVDVRHQDVRLTVPQRSAQGGERAFGCHRPGTGAPQPQHGGRGTRGHAVTGPGSPGDRGGRKSGGTALVGQRVQDGVGRGVVALAGAAEDAAERGEQHEGRQGQVARQLVQIPRGGRLGVQHRGQPLGSESRQRGVVQYGGRVHHRGQGVRGGHGGDGLGHVRAAADVTGANGDPAAECFQVPAEVVGPGGVRALSAEQHDVLGAALGQPAGDVAAEGTGTAGDQGAAAGRPLRFVAERGGRGTAQPAGEHPGGADGDLVLAGGAGQHVPEALVDRGVRVGGQVDQSAPAIGVLQCRDPA
ncbi:Uncharacterised protein [Streptomyces griseus]|nr:Uncharacterised protein [Streptomyces griseus]